jgi:cell division septation protein DedD
MIINEQTYTLPPQIMSPKGSRSKLTHLPYDSQSPALPLTPPPDASQLVNKDHPTEDSGTYKVDRRNDSYSLVGTFIDSQPKPHVSTFSHEPHTNQPPHVQMDYKLPTT